MRINIIGLLVFVLGIGVHNTSAEEVVTVVVCGNLTGYYVEEQHNYIAPEWSIHTLSCSAGENDPCRWADDPNTIVNFHNPIPAGVAFYDENGNVASVDVEAVNNAINNSIDNGNTSATIVVNNVTLHYSVSPLNDQPGYNQILVTLTVTN